MKIWLLKRRRSLIITVCVALTLVAAVYALAYAQVWRQFQDGRIYYHHRFYHLNAGSAAEEDIKFLLSDMRSTGTSIFGQEVYDLPPSKMTSMIILLQDKEGVLHSYELLSGP